MILLAWRLMFWLISAMSVSSLNIQPHQLRILSRFKNFKPSNYVRDPTIPPPSPSPIPLEQCIAGKSLDANSLLIYDRCTIRTWRTGQKWYWDEEAKDVPQAIYLFRPSLSKGYCLSAKANNSTVDLQECTTNTTTNQPLDLMLWKVQRLNNSLKLQHFPSKLCLTGSDTANNFTLQECKDVERLQNFTTSIPKALQ